jgi:phosphoglycolate phosphatase-like HAD superfamily hydrolase
MTAIGFTSAHSGQELSDAGADYLIDNMAKVADIVK